MKLDDAMDFGNELVISKMNVQKVNVSVVKKLTGVYDEHQKLVFLFDVSGSMGEYLETSAKDFEWTDEVIASVEEKLRGLIALEADANLSRWSDGFDAVSALPRDENGARIVTVDKNAVAKAYRFFNLKPTRRTPSRIELVKTLAKREIEARFDKYADSSVAVIPFGDNAKVSFDDGTRTEVSAVLERLRIGMDEVNENGTNILGALRVGVECCRKHPSSVGLHHFVLVSDGQDSNACEIKDWVPMLKASGVVIDYIHIGREGSANAAVQAACKELGGEFVVVNNVEDFETRFIQAVTRLCLPPAPEAN